METSPGSIDQILEASKRFARQLFTVGENRLELLIVEVQEEREHLLHAILLALGVASFGFLALLALNAAVVVWLWQVSPMGVLLASSGVYAIGAFFLYRRLTGLLRDWKMLSATLDQLRKDRECLEKKLD